ncbi:GAF domain-containing protein [Pseudarthrobacter equi]|uniref:GAF domain-containing protein n=1 Tax=Pseudarthrobacter equi TaxID=728066 RepID=UPI0028D00927|nr:GAF domain-containing protein [Pseudarthrobacter equi]
MAAVPSGQVGWGPLPTPPAPVFDSKDVENYLREVTHELMRDIRGEQRGISWAATLFRQGKAHTIAASTDQAREADREQCSFADGPVMEAVRTGGFVLLSDLNRDWRWPGYSSAAAAHGVQCLLSAPLAADGETSAAINVYADTAHTFTSDDLVRCRTYVRQVARALSVVVRVGERAEATVGIAVVQSSLVLVDLAVRSLMNEYGLSRDGALRFLQTQAVHHELDLRDAALNVVVPGAGMGRPGPAPAVTPQEMHDGVAGLQPAPAAELGHKPQDAAPVGAARKRRPRHTAGRKTA